MNIDVPYSNSKAEATYNSSGGYKYYSQLLDVVYKKDNYYNLTFKTSGLWDLYFYNKQDESYRQNINDYTVRTNVTQTSMNPNNWTYEEFSNMTDTLIKNTIEQGMNKYRGYISVGLTLYKNRMYLIYGVYGAAQGWFNAQAKVGYEGLSSIKIESSS